LLEVDNELGFVLYALGKCVFMLKGEDAFKLLTGNFDPATIDLRAAVAWHYKFEKVVKYLKITKTYIIVGAGDTIHWFDKNNPFSQQREMKFPLDEGEWIRQLSSNETSHQCLIVTSNQKLYEL